LLNSGTIFIPAFGYLTLPPERCGFSPAFALLPLCNQTLALFFRACLLRLHFAQRDQPGKRLVFIDFIQTRFDFAEQSPDALGITPHVVISVPRRRAHIDTRTAWHWTNANSNIIAESEYERSVGSLDCSGLTAAWRAFRNDLPIQLLHGIADRAEGCVGRSINRERAQIRIGFALKLYGALLEGGRIDALTSAHSCNFFKTRGIVRIGGDFIDPGQ
jgi:hypothetical protein